MGEKPKKDEELKRLENRYQWIGILVLAVLLAVWSQFFARWRQVDPAEGIMTALGFGLVIFGPIVYIAMSIAARKVLERRSKESESGL